MKVEDYQIQIPGKTFSEKTDSLSFMAKVVYGLIYQSYCDMYYESQKGKYFEGNTRYAKEPAFYCKRLGLTDEEALSVEKELKDKNFISTRVDTNRSHEGMPSIATVTDILVRL